jgi:hypothetical protein
MKEGIEMRYIIACIGVLAVMLIVVLAQQTPPSPPSNDNRPTEPKDPAGDPRAAAMEGLQAFRGLVDDQNFRELGFESREEVASAALGDPIRVYMVRLDRLREFQATGDPKALLTDTRQLIFPVTAGGQTRSSITVADENGRWASAAFGGPNLIKQLTTQRDNLARAESRPAASYSYVKVPSLNAYFIASESGVGGELMVTPLNDVPNVQMKQGASMAAKDAFAALVPAARAHDGKLS